MNTNKLIVKECRAFEIGGVEYLSEEKDILIHIKVFSGVTGREQDVAIRRSAITPKRVKEAIASAGGITPADKDLKVLVEKMEEFINELVVNREISSAHKNIGFTMNDGIEFRGYDSIWQSGVRVHSRYYGRFDISQKGSLDEIKMLYRTLNESGSLALPLSILGAAATVLSFSNNMWGTHIYNFIVHLLGSSSTGKSTIAKFIASFGGNPDGSDGFFLSYLATPNAIVSRLNGACGYPFAIDEFSTAKRNKNWSEFVYVLANGYDKDRCTAGGKGIGQTGHFEGVFVSTGEISVSSKCNKNNGVSARLFEITPDCLYQGESMDAFTASAEESDFIKNIADNNYGILTPLIAEELMRNSEKYNEIRQKWYRISQVQYKKDNLLSDIGERVMNYVAIIMTAAEVMESVLDIGLNLMELFFFYYFHFLYKNSEDTNMPTKVYSVVRQMILVNQEKLYNTSQIIGMPYLSEENCGYKIDLSHYPNRDRHKGADGKYYDLIYIFPVEYADEYLKQRGFEDPKQAINTLRKQKLIKSSRSGNNPKYELQTETVKMDTYAFWVEKQNDLYKYGVNTQDIIMSQL